MHQQYIADIEASSREALASVNPGPIFQHYGDNVWAAARAHLDAVTEHAAAPVIAKYTGVLGGADIEIFTTTFAIMQSIRLDRGPAARSIPDHNAPGRSRPGARPGPGSRTRSGSFRTRYASLKGLEIYPTNGVSGLFLVTSSSAASIHGTSSDAHLGVS